MTEPDDDGISLEDLSRDQLHVLVDQFCDAREKAVGANDPANALEMENRAHAAGDRLICGAVGTIKSRRLSAALNAFDVFDIEAANKEAAALGQRNFGPNRLRDREGVAATRRMLSRALLDCPWLPRWLVYAAVAELLWANFGGNTQWLARPTRPPGMPANHAPRTYQAAVMITRVYYYAGFHAMASLHDAAVAVLQDSEGSTSWDTLQRIGRKLKIVALCDNHRRRGEQDRADGRPFNPPLGADYDAVELEAARRALGTKMDRTKIV